MTEMAEGGATLAWRLLATLEGGSLLLATSALLAYSARRRVFRTKQVRRPVKTVLLTNSTNSLGKKIKTLLEARGCVVNTLPDSTNRASESAVAVEKRERADALVVVGAHAPVKTEGLQAMASVVSEDVYSNLKYLDSLSSLVHRGGSVSWACAGAATGSFQCAGPAFDIVLKANLEHLAKINNCDAVWVGRCDTVRIAAERVVNALLAGTDAPQPTEFSIRNVAQNVGRYIYRWLKIIT